MAHGFTVLPHCYREELAQVGLLLLEAGASVVPRDAAGRQALHAAAEVRDQEFMV